MYWRQLCWQQRNTDICRGELKSIRTADYVCLHKMKKNIYIVFWNPCQPYEVWTRLVCFGEGSCTCPVNRPRNPLADNDGCASMQLTAYRPLLKANELEWVRAETGGEGASGACYGFNPWVHLLMDEEKRGKNEATGEKQEQKEKRWTSERMKIFEDSSTHGGGGHGELCVAASGLRINLPFRYYQVLEGEIVCDAFSGFGEMFPCLKMYWHPWSGAGA